VIRRCKCCMKEKEHYVGGLCCSCYENKRHNYKRLWYLKNRKRLLEKMKKYREQRSCK
jgi:hypothetical protein